MSENCQLVVFSNKAYNAIIRESFDKDPVETGGILLGHVLDNGVWIVMEVLPPGINSIFRYAYFEYDDAFVNYLAQSVASQYKQPLNLLGLWHRHPGSMDTFSQTDDGTNALFLQQNLLGVISGLVNIDPQFRLTMYYMGHRASSSEYGRFRYDQVEIEVGDDIIPKEYFDLKFFNGNEVELHPYPPLRKAKKRKQRVRPKNIERPVEQLPLPALTKHSNTRLLYMLGGAIVLFVFLIFLFSGYKEFIDDTISEKTKTSINCIKRVSRGGHGNDKSTHKNIVKQNGPNSSDSTNTKKQ